MSEQVKAVLMPWSNGIDTVSKQFAGLEKTSAALASEGKNVKAQVDRLVASLCQNAGDCVEETYDLLKEHGKSDSIVMYRTRAKLTASIFAPSRANI